VNAAPGAAAPRTRDSAVDLVRAVALVRVVTYHAVGLPYAMTWFSAMPLMFFIAGYFMEASLQRERMLSCVAKRYVRVLVPLFPYAVMILAVYARAGLLGDLHPSNVVSYFVPLFSFPGPTGPVAADSPLGWTYIGLWYLQNYMVFVALSPVIRWMLRRAPWLLALGLAGAWSATLAMGVADRFVTYLVAWTFGMSTRIWPSISSHRKTWTWTSVVAMVIGSTVFFTLTAPNPSPVERQWGVVSVLLLGTAWITATMAFRPQLQSFAERRRVGPVVTWLNSRAVSVYLWHFPAYGIGAWVARSLLGAGWDEVHAVVSFGIAVPLTFLFATAFGWLEDVAARRPPVLVPRPRAPRPVTASVPLAGA
jgi:peptidoglycan/LPS O-acetylase OafA/YrhL